MLTESGTQAIDLICRFLLEPGDTVLVDDPCYFNFHALLKAHRVQAVGVTYTPNGPDVEQFEAALKEHSPRLYVTNSGVHNPTGATMSPVSAHRLSTCWHVRFPHRKVRRQTRSRYFTCSAAQWVVSFSVALTALPKRSISLAGHSMKCSGAALAVRK